MQLGLPLGIPLLSSRLKKEGIKTKVFETIFYRQEGDIDVNVERVKTHHSVKSVSYNGTGISSKDSDMLDDFMKMVADFKPDLIGLSSVESNFQRGLMLIDHLKEKYDVPVIVGGVFATMAPEIVIKERSVDMVCVGEGEEALLQLCRCLKNKTDHSRINNLWVKNGGRVIKNDILPLDAFTLPADPDFAIFDEKVFLRPMQGKIYKTVPLETSRGCPFNCTYCCAPALNALYRSAHERAYFRNKTMANVLAEIENSVAKYYPEFFYFTSETFLATKEDDFDAFIKGYKKFKIPFWIQTRPETIASDRIKRLKEVGLLWMSIGIEHGNEVFRRKYLKRRTTNEKIRQAIKILDDNRQGASVNSIIGFPFETRELIFDTINLNHELFKINKRIRCTISIFTPFHGSELSDLCLAHTLIEPLPYISSTNLIGGSVLKSELISKEELDGIFRTFSFYVHLPEKYRRKIELAEKFSEAGNAEFKKLGEKLNQYLC